MEYLNDFDIFIKSKWIEFIKENIDYRLKKTTFIIFSQIENKINLGENNFKVSSDVFDDINLNIHFEKNKAGTYDSYSNAIYVAATGDKIEINIRILDNDVNYNKLISSISHELKHVYDAITDDDVNSFLNTKPINDLKNYFRNNKYFEFIHLVYLSLKHEMEARNHMIYDMLRWLKTYDVHQLKNEYEKTYIFKALTQLKDFDHLKFINKFNYNDLLNYTNIFLTTLKGGKINNKEELVSFYKKYENFFHNVATEYIKKADEIIEELIIDKKPYMEKINLSIFRNNNDYNYLLNRLKEVLNNILKNNETLN